MIDLLSVLGQAHHTATPVRRSTGRRGSVPAGVRYAGGEEISGSWVVI
jgi:hypothetical protein